MLTDTHLEDLHALSALNDGWCGGGLGDAPRPPALTAARDLLHALGPAERLAWSIGADADGGVRFERDYLSQAPAAMFFVDVDRRGALNLVWFDRSCTPHERAYDSASLCAAGVSEEISALLASTPVLAGI